MSITILGLGAGDMSQISYQAIKELNSGKKIFLRTSEHPIVKKLDITYESFDFLYEDGSNFEEVYDKIAKKIISVGKNEDIIYAVPGHPRVAETSVSHIEKYAENDKINIKFVASMSFIDAMYTYLGFDPSNGFRLIDSFCIRKKDLDTNVNIIITQVYDRFIASNVKLSLMNYYSDEQEVWLVRAAGIEQLEYKEKIKLYELDRTDILFDHLTSIFIPKGGEKKYKDIYDLIDITKTLRGDNGCNWDKEQTHKSLTKYLIEESYELIDAINNDDIEGIIEELGDLMYHIVLHSQIGLDDGYFDFDEVCNSSVEKMISRHPHVFGEEKIDYIENQWDINKMKEKGENKVSESMRREPKYLPALMKAIKIQSKAANVGFDWNNIDDVFSKVNEEYNEFIYEYKNDNHESMKEEYGDLLFSIVKLGKFLNIDPENSLNKTTEKFINRFEYVEDSLIEKKINFDKSNIETMINLWNESKKYIKNSKKL